LASYSTSSLPRTNVYSDDAWIGLFTSLYEESSDIVGGRSCRHRWWLFLSPYVAVIRLATFSAAHPRRFSLVVLVFFLSSYLTLILCWRLSWRNCVDWEGICGHVTICIGIIRELYRLVNYRVCRRVYVSRRYTDLDAVCCLLDFWGYDHGEGLIIFVLTSPIHGRIGTGGQVNKNN